MPIICHEDLSFSGLVLTFKLLASKHTETSVWHLCHMPGHFNRLSVWSLTMINFTICMDGAKHGSQFQKFKCHRLINASALCWVSATHKLWRNVQVGLLVVPETC